MPKKDTRIFYDFELGMTYTINRLKYNASKILGKFLKFKK